MVSTDTGVEQESEAAALALAQGAPSAPAFAALMAALASSSRDEAPAVDVLESHLRAWPDALRMWRVWDPAHPGWALVRRLDLSTPQLAKPWRPRSITAEAAAGLTEVCVELGWPKHSDTGAPLCTGISFWTKAPPMPKLSVLDIRLATLNEVELGLERVPGLSALSISDRARERGPFDMDQLAELTKLRRLELERLDLGDQALPEALAIEQLRLIEVGGLGGLEGARLSALRRLELVRLELEDRPPPDMPALEYVLLEGVGGVSSLVAGLPEAAVLEAELFRHDQFEGLAGSARLRKLTCSFWDCPEHPPLVLGGLPGLERLRYEVYMDSEGPAEIGAQQQLRELALPAGDRPTDSWPEAVCDLAELSTLVELRALDLSRRKVRNPGALAQLTKLERLNLHGCEGIESLDFLAELAQLEVLDLPSNIADLGVLARLPKLRELRLEGPKHGDGEILEDWTLSDCAVLGGLAQLEVLRIADKDEVELLDLSGCVSLRVLEIGQLPKLEAIVGLEQLPRLSSLCVELEDPSPYGNGWEARGLGWKVEGRAAVEAMQAQLREAPVIPQAEPPPPPPPPVSRERAAQLAAKERAAEVEVGRARVVAVRERERAAAASQAGRRKQRKNKKKKKKKKKR